MVSISVSAQQHPQSSRLLLFAGLLFFRGKNSSELYTRVSDPETWVFGNLEDSRSDCPHWPPADKIPHEKSAVLLPHFFLLYHLHLRGVPQASSTQIGPAPAHSRHLLHRAEDPLWQPVHLETYTFPNACLPAQEGHVTEGSIRPRQRVCLYYQEQCGGSAELMVSVAPN